MEKKRVVIVAQGSFGTVQEADYAFQVEHLRRVVEAARRNDYITRENVPAATFEVVPSVEALRDVLRSFPHPNTVIFRTRGMLDEARIIKRDHPSVRVIVYTGLIRKEEEGVLFVNKAWVFNDDALQSVILD